MSRIIRPADAPGLIAGARESKKVTITIELEGSCPTVMGERRVERFRTEDGRWVSAKTIIRRLESLGATVLNFSIGGAGSHTPIY